MVQAIDPGWPQTIALTTLGAVLVAVGGWAAAYALSPERRVAAAATKQPRDRFRLVRLLIVVAWAYGVIPSLLNIAAHGRGRATVDSVVPLTGMPLQVGHLLLLVFLALSAGVAFHTFLSRMPAPHGTLLLFLAPVAALYLAQLHAGGRPSILTLSYPLAVIAFWRLRPPIQILSIVGVLAIATAAGSIVLGFLKPDWATTPPPLVGDKAAFPTLLAGPYFHPNSLGIMLSLGLPFVFLLRRRLTRYAGMITIVFAVVWSGNRNAMLAVGIALVVYFLLQHRPQHVGWAVIPMLGAAVLTIRSPLTFDSVFVYSGRGQIWLGSLEDWAAHPWLGGGPDYYARSAQINSQLGLSAFSGHNLMVHLLATGGLVTLVCFVALFVGVVIRALRLAHGRVVALCYLVMFAFDSWLQSPPSLLGLEDKAWVAWMPLAVILFARSVEPGTSDAAVDHTAASRQQDGAGREVRQGELAGVEHGNT